MAVNHFTKRLSPVDLIELFPQLLEALGIAEPDEPIKYFVIEQALLEENNEGALVEAMGFVPHISIEKARASGDAEQMRIAQMQHTMADMIRRYGFVFAERALEANNVYSKLMSHKKEYIVYVSRQPAAQDFNTHIAEMAGIMPDDFKLKYTFDYPQSEIQLSNLITLGRLAEGALRKLMPDGRPYRDGQPADSDAALCAKSLLAAETVWQLNGGDICLPMVYREAYLMAGLTHVGWQGALDLEYGMVDDKIVEDVRQKIAYAILSGRKHLDAEINEDVYINVAHDVPVRKQIRHAAQLLNQFIRDEFDGDLHRHAEVIALSSRVFGGEASQTDHVLFASPEHQKRLPALLALSALINGLQAFESICHEHYIQQQMNTPRVMSTARDHIAVYHKLAMVDDDADTPLDLARQPYALGADAHSPQQPDRSVERLERYIPCPDSRPN